MVLWALCVLVTLAWLAGPAVAVCELVPGSSVLGEASRSWLPPGTTCTYELPIGPGEPVVFVERPSALRLVVVGVVVAGPLAGWLLRRRPATAAVTQEVPGA